MNARRKLTKQQEQDFLLLTINGIVRSTGMPAAGFAITQSGVADKATLKNLVRKGLLKTVRVTAGQGHVVAYYTDDVVPSIIKDREAKADDSGREQLGDHQPTGGASEVLSGGLRSTEEAQEAVDYERGIGGVFDD